jgi:hypothetical protein
MSGNKRGMLTITHLQFTLRESRDLGKMPKAESRSLDSGGIHA